MTEQVYSVSEFHALINQTLQFAYPEVIIEGEVSSYKINQNKWVFFDLKDNETTISCFMSVYQLKTVLEDGMLIRVQAVPNVTKWGKFSLTVRGVELAGEGDVKKAFELMRTRFEQEGLFSLERKRQLPTYPSRVGLITSSGAAAYADFIAIINDRWAGLEVDHLQVQVQGLDAPKQIVEAIEYFNSQSKHYDVLVIIRGGGSSEDLQAFNSEDVVRAVYGSEVPTLAGVGHETDTTLTDLVADVRAATPTDAARRLVPDKTATIHGLSETIALSASRLQEQIHVIRAGLELVRQNYIRTISQKSTQIKQLQQTANFAIEQHMGSAQTQIQHYAKLIQTLNPQAVLQRGYAIVTVAGKTLKDPSIVKKDDLLMIQLAKGSIVAKKIAARKAQS
jgi:exodeoxyribonuclease VII large subunit